MTQAQVELLQSRLRHLLENALRESRNSEIARLAALAEQVASLRTEGEAIDQELQRIAAEVGGTSVTGDDCQQEAPPSALGRDSVVVHLNWAAHGYPAGTETISEHTGALTLRRFVERVVEVMGIQRLAELHQLVTGRGPLVSRSPETEFINRVNRSSYAHKPIRGTDWYVLTHSATEEKKCQIERACAGLGLSSARVDRVRTAGAPILTVPPSADDGRI